MNTVIGIDVGGTTTKIVGLNGGKLMEPLYVKAADPITSTYGAFGKFTVENALELNKIERVMVTGVGSTYITKPIYGLPCVGCAEDTCIGRGGLYLSGLDEAIVVSMGTGTAMVHAVNGKAVEYLGGTGVGGGTLMGLSKILLGMDNVDHIVDLAEKGNLNKIDLRISDIAKNEIFSGISVDMTAANFGKVSDIASKSDIALAIINMVFETIGMCSIFAARSFSVRDIVLTGNLTNIPQAIEIFKNLSSMFNMNFIIPGLAQFGTVIGAALSAGREDARLYS